MDTENKNLGSASKPVFLLVSKLLAWYAVLLGLLSVGGGVGHLLGVLSVALKQGKPYNSRMVFLLVISGVLLYTGTINIAVNRSLQKAQIWALGVATFTTVCLIIFLNLLFPLPDGGSSPTGYLILNVPYLFLLIFTWITRHKNSKAVVAAGFRLSH